MRSDAASITFGCAINILAQLQKNLGTLEKVEKIIRINGFVNSDLGFTAHPKVIDAASDLMFSVFQAFTYSCWGPILTVGLDD